MPDEFDPAHATELLRRFEPVLRFTRGEKFFPADAEAYVRNCSLWEQTPRHFPMCLVKKGELTPEKLAGAYATKPRAIHYLKFVEPLSVTSLAAQQIQKTLTRKPDETFRAGFGRLARVGYLARLIDAIFSLVLLTRGRVPGSAGAAAARTYERMQNEGQGFNYYGRVVRQDKWVVLQYWFFYYFNDWRSGFYGANDHEGDWETLSIYLSDELVTANSPALQPEWLAYAAHDHTGDDLRRSWNDPELQKEGEHPVVYIGAGSHASYYQSGEYLTELGLSFLAPVVRLAESLRAVWRKRFRPEGEPTDGTDDAWLEILRVPFVDYARGDGLSLGPGQAMEWGTPVLINEPPGWMSNYRGLWGLFTGDPFDGEDAPGGAMYNRDGTPRPSWFDPVGWCGLDQVPPAAQMLDAVQDRQRIVGQKITALAEQIEGMRVELSGLATENAALRIQPDLIRPFEENQGRKNQLAHELNVFRARLAAEESLHRSLVEYETRLRSGFEPPLRDHLRRPVRPASRAELRSNRFADVWAAASIGIMLLGVVALILFARQYLIPALVTVAFLVALIESWFKRRFARFVTNISLIFALAAMIILVIHFLWLALTVLVLVIGIYILWENLRELWN